MTRRRMRREMRRQRDSGGRYMEMYPAEMRREIGFRTEDDRFGRGVEGYTYDNEGRYGGRDMRRMSGGRRERMSSEPNNVRRIFARGSMSYDEFPDEDECEPITLEEAREWVRGMHNTDPQRPHGEGWSVDEVREIAKAKGMPTKGQEVVDLYAAMNMMYSDYYEVAKKFGCANDEFFLCMALAFIEDEDAEEEKVSRYYEFITKDEE